LPRLAAGSRRQRFEADAEWTVSSRPDANLIRITTSSVEPAISGVAPHGALAVLLLLLFWWSPTQTGRPSAVRRPLGVSDRLVGKEGDAVTDGLRVDEAHGFLVAGLAEEALAGPEHDGVDHQPQLVDEVVL
jgi:hypothetical protein